MYFLFIGEQILHILHESTFFRSIVYNIIKLGKNAQGVKGMNIQDKECRKTIGKYVGNDYQIFGTRHYRLTDGASDGCHCIDVRTGSGFEYTIVPDRGLDISLASYKGINLSYLTENMETHPAFYNSHESEWLRTFSGGLLTTCGPTNVGNPCEDDGEKLGHHGRWSAFSAKKVCDNSDFENGKIEISGTMHESYTFGCKLKINRKITSQIGSSSVTVEDCIENEGGKPVPLNLLYHINLGYPLLCEKTEIFVSSDDCFGYDDYSQKRLDEWKIFKAPCGENEELNYLHTFNPKTEEALALAHNKDIEGGLAVYIKFNPQQLPYLTQWKLEDLKDYVLALEPANVPCESRNVLRERGQLPYLAPGEKVDFKVEIGVISGGENIKQILGK